MSGLSIAHALHTPVDMKMDPPVVYRLPLYEAVQVSVLAHMEKDCVVAVGGSEIPAIAGRHTFARCALVTTAKFQCSGV